MEDHSDSSRQSGKNRTLVVLTILLLGGAGVYVVANLYHEFIQHQREPDPLERQVKDIERRVEENTEQLKEQVEEVLEQAQDATD